VSAARLTDARECATSMQLCKRDKLPESLFQRRLNIRRTGRAVETGGLETLNRLLAI
jgi:hypothetical protein